MSNIDSSDMPHNAATDSDGPAEERSAAGTGVGFAMRRGMSVRRRRGCPLSGPRAPIIDYKNILLLKRYVSEGGRMLPRRITAVSAKKQRELSCAIKRARILALLPFTSH